MVNLFKYCRALGILAVALSSMLLNFSDFLAPPQAQALQFPPSGNRGAPKTTTGGGTRGDEEICLSHDTQELPLVALMPNRENTGKTATATPTLYWYVPKTTATTGEFVITDEKNETVYYISFALPQKAGIVKLNIPAQASLKTGQTYTWFFMIVCDRSRRNQDKFLQGTIEYIQLATEQKEKLAAAKGLEKARLAAQTNLWPETLEAIAQVRDKNPQEWLELLKSVGLEDLADRSFIECCQPQ